MKRRRVTPSTAGGAVEASLENIGAAFTNDGVAASLPRIPGLSMEHIPTFLHVLQVTTKFFQRDLKTESFTVVDWEQLKNKSITSFGQGADSSGTWNSGSNTTGHQSIHDSIMNRMDAVSNNSGSTPTASSNDNDHKRRFVQAVNTWLEEVQHHAKRRKKQQESNDATATTTEKSGKRQEKPVPYSMFLYLWDMQQEHKRVTVRRSALFLSGLLLLRSKDCRYHIDQETHLAEWVSNIGVKVDGSDVSGANSNKKIIQLALLQKEAVALISHLLDKGFGSRYVKLAVAAKSLKHRCIALETGDLNDSSVTPPGMANRRKLRDFALLHGQKEIQKVGKLLDLADECLEILVPRIDGVRRPSRSWKRESISRDNQDLENSLEEKQRVENQEESRHDNVNGDGDFSDSDDDDIDWEDGDDIETNNTNSSMREHNSHLSAVESTMAAMEKTAGNTLFSGGRLEINFDQRADEEDNVVGTGKNGTHAPDENKARRKLEKIVHKLSTRHLVRLSAWLDGLRNSDNLVQTESASLVSLSPAKDELRRELISRLSALKQDVSTVLSSASRLNIRVQDGTNDARAQTSETNDSNPADRNTRNAVASLEGMPAAPASRAELPNNRVPKKKKRIKISYNK